MLFIQVIGSQSATAFKQIQNNKCHVHSTAQQMALKQEKDRLREQSETEKEGRERQTNETQELFKKDKESWSMDADEIN